MHLDKLKTTDGLDVRGKRVLVRADLNVPVRDGKVSDATRLARLVPGLQDLARRGAKVIVMSHFGRPKGGPDPQYSLKPVAEELGTLLGLPVAFAGDCIGEPAAKVVGALRDGEVAVLENLRFHKGEEKNDPAFAKALAALGDIFVGDAFSTAHRAHASTEAIARLLPAYAGPLMMEEIDALRSVLEKPARPVAAVIGGAKVSTKIDVLTNLAAKVDKLIIGGAMANTFFLAEGVEIGKSLAEPDLAKTALEIMHAAKQRHCEVILPHDFVVAAKLEAGASRARRGDAGGAIGPHDPRRRPQDRRALHRHDRPLQDAVVERPARSLRGGTVRRGHVRAGARGGGADQGRQAHVGGRRRRHRGRAQCRRRHGRFQLRVDRRRRVPGVARGPRAARRRRARARLTGPGPRRLASDQLHLELPAHDVRGSSQRAKRDGTSFSGSSSRSS